MNKYIFALIGFGAGAIVGAVGSKIYFEKKYADLADEEIDSVKKMYLEKELKRDSNEQKLDNTDILKDSLYRKDDFLKKNNTAKSINKKINYNDISKDKEEEVKAEKENPEESEPMDPYQITEQEFEEEHKEYDKINISYYNEDGSIVTDDEEVLDADDCIGVENLDKFVESGENEMFFRNNSISADFDLCLVYGNYGKELGM